MPAYVHATYAVVGFGLVLALLAPAPRMPLPRAARACRILLTLGCAILLAAVAMPAFDVWYPALAAYGAALCVWFAMFWLARQPSLYDRPPLVDVVIGDTDDQDDDDGGGGGGGGGGPPRPDPRPEPPSPDGIDWEQFDRQRRSWEHERRYDPVNV